MLMMCHAMMKRSKKVMVIAHKGRYFCFVNISAHRKPKMSGEMIKKFKTQINKCRDGLLRELSHKNWNASLSSVEKGL